MSPFKEDVQAVFDELSMFCRQCEQARGAEGCFTTGVCGKTPETAALQDLLTYVMRGLSHYAVEARRLGLPIDDEINHFSVRALFSTLTNVNFDPARFQKMIGQAAAYRDQLHDQVRAAGGRVNFEDPATSYEPPQSLDQLVEDGRRLRLPIDWDREPDIRSLQETTLYGIRGFSAYADHAAILGQTDDEVFSFLHSTLAKMVDKSLDLNDWVGLTLETGRINLKAMELLDAGNTGAYGHPVPTEVPLGHKKGKAILVSGHDLADLEALLKQTEGKGIYIYTHGEMLPTHGYPELKKYEHFYGHFGTAWQNQKKEFKEFPGAILMTTNCLQEPQDEYRDNLFTTGLVGWPGAVHVEHHDFGPVIQKALEMPGFAEDEDRGTVWVGFARNAILGQHDMGSVAETIIDHVKAGKIRHFYLVGGCDGAKPGRNYYTEFVEKAPADTVILTLACGKFRFFDKQLGAIDGIPRLVDVGQCNDAYSAVQIAVALANAFDLDVNDLPLSLILSWYEQKAVAILLSLLHLGIKDIRIGPSLPAFVSPNVLDVLVQNFGIKPISTPEEDLEATLSAA
ncbi:MAG: hydroxylamine reductase [Thermoleophilia bacterium]